MMTSAALDRSRGAEGEGPATHHVALPLLAAPPAQPASPVAEVASVSDESGPRTAGPARSRDALREVESSAVLDGRQLFFVFVGTAIAACLVFALGVFVGRRVEQRAAARAAQQQSTDPLAVLDQLANAEEELTFPRVLREGRSGPAARAASPAESAERPRDGASSGSRANMPRFALRSTPIAKRAEAEELVKRLRQAGYKASLVELPRSALSGGGRELRVQLGDFVAAEQGQALRGELFRRYNLSTTITKL
jgi:hypothetical protein